MEEWKNIKNYEGLYEVSNLGQIRSLDKYRKYCNEFRFVEGKILKFCNCLGYYIVTLSNNNVRTNYRVHRIVAETFIPNPDNKPYVNHIDGNKINNKVENLEWVTAQENVIHSYQILKRNSNKGLTWENHKFSIDECLQMVNYYKQNMSFRKIAVIFNSNHNTISKIIRNEKYNN